MGKREELTAWLGQNSERLGLVFEEGEHGDTAESAY